VRTLYALGAKLLICVVQSFLRDVTDDDLGSSCKIRFSMALPRTAPPKPVTWAVSPAVSRILWGERGGLVLSHWKIHVVFIHVDMYSPNSSVLTKCLYCGAKCSVIGGKQLPVWQKLELETDRKTAVLLQVNFFPV
jgi:hypothetical protein